MTREVVVKRWCRALAFIYIGRLERRDTGRCELVFTVKRWLGLVLHPLHRLRLSKIAIALPLHMYTFRGIHPQSSSASPSISLYDRLKCRSIRTPSNGHDGNSPSSLHVLYSTFRLVPRSFTTFIDYDVSFSIFSLILSLYFLL